MPTSTPEYGIVKPTSGAEPADLYGVSTRLADSVEAALVARFGTFTDVTYNGTWVDFGTPYEEVSYALDGNIVRLRGCAKHATTSTTGTVFTLPTGYRPAKQRVFRVGANTGGADIVVETTGNVKVNAYVSSGNAGILFFDGISFDLAA